MVRGMLRRSLNKVFLALVLIASPVAISGCHGGAKSADSAHVKPGEMPAGEEWPGVYYSPTYGMLHLVVEGDTASGAWRTTAGDSASSTNSFGESVPSAGTIQMAGFAVATPRSETAYRR